MGTAHRARAEYTFNMKFLLVCTVIAAASAAPQLPLTYGGYYGFGGFPYAVPNIIQPVAKEIEIPVRSLLLRKLLPPLPSFPTAFPSAMLASPMLAFPTLASPTPPLPSSSPLSPRWRSPSTSLCPRWRRWSLLLPVTMDSAFPCLVLFRAGNGSRA